MTFQEQSDLFKALQQSGMPLTPTLNSALEHVAGDKSMNDSFRVLLWLWRRSWGNWYPFAVKDNHRRLNLSTAPPGTAEFLTELIIGNGPCPRCNRNSDSKEPGLHPNFRWHISCLAKLYAADAITSGNQKQREWAQAVLNDAEIPSPSSYTS